MKRILISLLMALSLTSVSAQTTTCVNPLTYTDIPDNDVIRVGDDFYMVSTTMFFCPGAPIMHSRDLVHWRIVNYIYDCLNDDDVYNLRNGRNAYGQGQWATSLRYHDGVYYALFVANDQRKTYVYRTTDIQNGKWEGNVLEGAFLHDASILFDDGHVYVVHGNGDLRITELTPDLRAVKPGGVNQVLIHTPREGFGLPAEGAHFYHIGDYYYVIEIDWPRNDVRIERCWRSKELLGQYESRVMLKGKFDGREDGVAQGAIFDTPKGDWYSVMFQDHGAVGRIPTLQPLKWVDGWPILGDNTVPVKQFEVNLEPDGDNYVWANDEFKYKRNSDLALVWQWNHKPIDDAWSVTARRGWLRLTTSQLATGLFDARNTLTQRTVGPRCINETCLDASRMKPGDYAGLAAFMSNNCKIGVTVDEQGKRYIQATRGTRNSDEEVLRVPLSGKRVWLRIQYVFTPQSDDTCGPDIARMSYSTNGKKWVEVPGELQMRYTLDLFIGYRAALYNYATREVGGHADFDYFHQRTY